MISLIARQFWLRYNVPVPNPDDLWPFTVGLTRMLSMEPDCFFRVDRIGEGYIEGTQILDREVHGPLILNEPCCVLQKPEGEPIMALTLRRIEAGVAYIQVSMFTAPGDKIRLMTKQ